MRSSKWKTIISFRCAGEERTWKFKKEFSFRRFSDRLLNLYIFFSLFHSAPARSYVMAMNYPTLHSLHSITIDSLINEMRSTEDIESSNSLSFIFTLGLLWPDYAYIPCKSECLGMNETSITNPCHFTSRNALIKLIKSPLLLHIFTCVYMYVHSTKWNKIYFSLSPAFILSESVPTTTTHGICVCLVNFRLIISPSSPSNFPLPLLSEHQVQFQFRFASHSPVNSIMRMSEWYLKRMRWGGVKSM